MALTVGSRELRTRLGTYLRIVRSGRTLVVTDRGCPVAELRPLSAPKDGLRAIFEEMAAEGKVTLPTDHRRPGSFRPVRPKKGAPTVAGIISEDRGDLA